MIVLLQLLIHSKSYISGTRDVHGGAVVAGFGKSHRGSGVVAVGFRKNRRGSGRFWKKSSRQQRGRFFSSVAVRQRQLFSRDGNLCLELCSY
jgi:hypothetical protein